jgi:glycosyltransferase involved in cell wall biosynthesis
MPMTKVSVVIPVYNVANYVGECLSSICRQTLEDIEIICIDDCGQDDSMSVIENYAKKDSRIRIVRHNHHKGLGAARNSGLNVVRGEYVGFVNSDDYISLDYYESLYSVAEANDADIVQSLIMLFFEENHEVKSYNLNKDILCFDSTKADDLIEKFIKMDLYYCAGMCWNKIFRTEMIRKYNITFSKGLYGEDNLFVIRAAFYSNKIMPISKISIFYYCRQRRGSIVKLANKKLHFDILFTHKDIVSFLNRIQISKREYLFIFSRLMDRIYWEYGKLLGNQALLKYRYEFIKQWKQLVYCCLYPEGFGYFKDRERRSAFVLPGKTIRKFFNEVIVIFIQSIKIAIKFLIFSPAVISQKRERLDRENIRRNDFTHDDAKNH